MESETPPEGAAVHRIADQPTLGRVTQQQFTDRATGSDTDRERGDPVIGDLSREHWMVPVRGSADADGVAQVIARRDGTVSLHLTCGDSRTAVRFDVCRAAQLCTGIWEAAGAAQHLTDDQPPPPQPPHGSEDLPEAWRTHLRRNTPSRRNSPKFRRRKQTPENITAAMDAPRTIGLLLRRIRADRNKSLEVSPDWPE